MKGNDFIIYQEINAKDKKLALIVKVDNKEYYVARIVNKFSKRVKNKLKSKGLSYCKYYHNENIEFASILLNGIIHPRLIISGEKKNASDKIVFLSNGGELEYQTEPTAKAKEFYYYVDLNKSNKRVYIYLNKELILVINNKIVFRIWNKIISLIKRFFQKIYHVIYVFYRGIRAAWIQYHFLIPPRMWKKYWIEFVNKMRNKENGLFYNPNNIVEYNKWLKIFEKDEQVEDLEYQPLISILIPVYNIEKKYLNECVKSILQQTYQNFEICLVDDASTNVDTLATLKELENNAKIHVKYRKENGHISKATNDALKMAKGEFIALMDNDDTIAPNALYEVVKVLNNDKKIDFIYSDEDKLNNKNVRCYPHFKPDFSPDTLMSLNYICHFSVLRKKIVEKVGGFEVGLEGAQDHDLFLKVSEVTNRIYHIPKILYHWRMIEGSTSASLNSKSYASKKAKIALENALKRRNLTAEIKEEPLSGYHIINYTLKKEPMISIIIPTKDLSGILEKCLKSLYKKTTYKNYEVIVVNNNSEESETFKLFEKYKNNYKNFKVIDANMEFNYSKINNLAIKQAKGEYIVLLNNDTEIITPEWLNIMVGYASLDHIGAVGPKLLYPDNTVQHGGVILGLGGVASHAYIGSSRRDTGLYSRLRVPYNYSAVTAACLMVKKSKFDEVGGLEEDLKVAYNDMDFNIKLLKKGYYNIFLPQVELYHYESKSRGYDTTTEKYQRFLKEQEYMYKKWPEEIKYDKMYNENFSKKGWFVLDKRRIKK